MNARKSSTLPVAPLFTIATAQEKSRRFLRRAATQLIKAKLLVEGGAILGKKQQGKIA